MKTKFKNVKGITLIALVITIIVLLILAGVTIATLTGENGILTKAKTAQTTTNEENAKEQIKTAVMGSYGKDGKLNYGDLKTNLEQIGIKELPNEALYPLKVTLDGVKATIKENGEVEFGKTIEVGDYVDYDPTLGANASDLTYTSTTDKTGADSNQEFNVSTYKNAGYGWRVLGVSNGKIRLISEEFIGPGKDKEIYIGGNRTYYTLEGQKGYINGIEELNKISAIFGHGKGAESATSITVDDINAITGYNPETAKYGKGYFGEYGNKVTYTRGSGTDLSSSATNGKTWSGPQSTFNYYNKSTKEFVPLTSGSTEITSTIYEYEPTTLGTDKYAKPLQGVDENGTFNEIYKMIFGDWERTEKNGYYRNFTGTGTEPNYWLASDYADAYNSRVYWGLRYVDGGYVSDGILYFSSGYEYSGSIGVRPVVSLKSDISLEWNDTAGEWKMK